MKSFTPFLQNLALIYRFVFIAPRNCHAGLGPLHRKAGENISICIKNDEVANRQDFSDRIRELRGWKAETFSRFLYRGYEFPLRQRASQEVKKNQALLNCRIIYDAGFYYFDFYFQRRTRWKILRATFAESPLVFHWVGYIFGRCYLAGDRNTWPMGDALVPAAYTQIPESNEILTYSISGTTSSWCKAGITGGREVHTPMGTSTQSPTDYLRSTNIPSGWETCIREISMRERNRERWRKIELGTKTFSPSLSHSSVYISDVLWTFQTLGWRMLTSINLSS